MSTSEPPDRGRSDGTLADRYLRRIVYLKSGPTVNDGMDALLGSIELKAQHRPIEYTLLTVDGDRLVENHVGRSDEPSANTLHRVSQWSPSDTVIVAPDLSIASAPTRVREELERFPILFKGFTPLPRLLTLEATPGNFHGSPPPSATRLLLLTRSDRQLYSQFGIHNHDLAFQPIEPRASNPYTTDVNSRITYIGPIRDDPIGPRGLLNLVRALRDSGGLSPLYVYTPSSRVESPALGAFLEGAVAQDLSEDVVVILDDPNEHAALDATALLILPYESGPTQSPTQSLAHGLPTLGLSWSPDASSFVLHGHNGFLIEDYEMETLMEVLAQLDSRTLSQMSAAAFKDHRRYTFERYFEVIEQACATTLNAFDGRNRERVLPKIAPIHGCRRSAGSTSSKLNLDGVDQEPPDRVEASASTSPSGAMASRLALTWRDSIRRLARFPLFVARRVFRRR